MALHNYAEMDEDDFYGQAFERDGVVSVWVSVSGAKGWRDDADVLQDLCGVGYYYLDNQEMIYRDGNLAALRDLLSHLSYSSSFADSVANAAAAQGIHQACFILVQYDFAYDPQRVTRPVERDPVFLGVFPYSTGG